MADNSSRVDELIAQRALELRNTPSQNSLDHPIPDYVQGDVDALDIYSLGANYGTERGALTAAVNPDQLEADIRNLSAFELSAKYGTDTAMQALNALNSGSYLYERDVSRKASPGDLMADSAIGFTSGATTGFANMLALLSDWGPQSSVNLALDKTIGALTGDEDFSFMRDISQTATSLLNRFSTGVSETGQSLQSDANQARSRARAARRTAREADNFLKYQADLAKDEGDVVSRLRYIGRGISGVSKDLTSDLFLLATDTSTALGSLMAAGGMSAIGKLGVKAVERAIISHGSKQMQAKVAQINALNKQGKAGSEQVKKLGEELKQLYFNRVSRVEGSLLRKVAHEASFPLSIGLLEGGAALNQTYTETMALSHNDLLTTSPMYGELIKQYTRQGMSPDEAKNEAKEKVAIEAASYAGGLQFLMAAPTGYISRIGEFGLPLKGIKKELRQVVLQEPLANFLQGGTRRLASNIATRDFVDPSQDIIQGTGESLGEGAIFGFLMGTAVKAETLPMQGAFHTARYIANRSEKLKNKATSFINEKARTKAETNFRTQSQNLNTILDSVDSLDISNENKQNLRESINSLVQGATFSEATLDNVTDEYVRDILKTSAQVEGWNSLNDAVTGVASLIQNTELSLEDRVAIAASLLELMEPFITSTQNFEEQWGEFPEVMGSQAGNVLKTVQNMLNQEAIPNAFRELTNEIGSSIKTVLDQEGSISDEGFDSIVNNIDLMIDLDGDIVATAAFIQAAFLSNPEVAERFSEAQINELQAYVDVAVKQENEREQTRKAQESPTEEVVPETAPTTPTESTVEPAAAEQAEPAAAAAQPTEETPVIEEPLTAENVGERLKQEASKQKEKKEVKKPVSAQTVGTITDAGKEALSNLGYPTSEISKLTAEEARDILRSPATPYGEYLKNQLKSQARPKTQAAPEAASAPKTGSSAKKAPKKATEAPVQAPEAPKAIKPVQPTTEAASKPTEAPKESSSGPAVQQRKSSKSNVNLVSEGTAVPTGETAKVREVPVVTKNDKNVPVISIPTPSKVNHVLEDLNRDQTLEADPPSFLNNLRKKIEARVKDLVNAANQVSWETASTNSTKEPTFASFTETLQEIVDTVDAYNTLAKEHSSTFFGEPLSISKDFPNVREIVNASNKALKRAQQKVSIERSEEGLDIPTLVNRTFKDASIENIEKEIENLKNSKVLPRDFFGESASEMSKGVVLNSVNLETAIKALEQLLEVKKAGANDVVASIAINVIQNNDYVSPNYDIEMRETYLRKLLGVNSKFVNKFFGSYKPRSEHQGKSRFYGYAQPIDLIAEVLRDPATLIDFVNKDLHRRIDDDVLSEFREVYVEKLSPFARKVLENGHENNVFNLDSPELRREVQTVEGVRLLLEKRLEDFLDSKPLLDFTSSDGEKIVVDSWRQFLKEGYHTDIDILSKREARILSFVHINANGSITYNNNLLELASVAGITWAISRQGHNQNLSESELRARTGLDSSNITGDLVDVLNATLSREEMVDSLAKKLKSYWGVVNHIEADMADTFGQVNTFAEEVLEVLTNLGLVEKQQLDLSIFSDTGKKLTLYSQNLLEILEPWSPTRDPNKSKGIGTKRDLMDYIVLNKPEPVTIISHPEEFDLPETVHNSSTPLTKTQKTAIANRNRERYFPNLPQYVLYEAMGMGNIINYFGGGSHLPGMSVNLRESIKGKNLSVRYPFEEAQNWLLGMFNASQESDTPLKDQFIRFSHTITSVGRFLQRSPFTPESNKLLRSLFTPTKSTVDMSGEDAASEKTINYYYQALAQGLGMTVEKRTMGTNRQILEDIFKNEDHPLSELVTELKRFISQYGIENLYKLPRVISKPTSEGFERGLADKLFKLLDEAVAKQTETPIEGFKLKKSDRAFHVLMDYAIYQTIKETKPSELKSYETLMYVEADGVANGALNSLMLLSHGAITGEFLRMLEKGGVSFRLKDGKPVAYVSLGASAHISLYETAASGDSAIPNIIPTTTRIMERFKTLKDLDKTVLSTTKGADLTRQLDQIQRTKDTANGTLALLALVSEYQGKDNFGIDFETGLINMSGGLTKFKMIAHDYMSSTSGMAGQDVQDIFNTVYEIMTANTDKVPQDFKDKVSVALTQALGDQVRYDKSRKIFRLEHLGKETRVGLDYVNGQIKWDEHAFSAREAEVLKSNLTALITEPMADSIGQVMGESVERGKSTIALAVQVQSLVYSRLVKRAIEAKIAEKAKNPNYDKKTQFITHAEFDEILESLAHVEPVISNGSQNIRVMRDAIWTGAEGLSSTSLTSIEETMAQLFTPDQAGISAVAYLIISGGDGLAMTNMFQGDAVERLASIFDGAHVPLDLIEQAGKRLNNAASSVWKNNIYNNVLNSYSEVFQNPEIAEQFLEILAEERQAFEAQGKDAVVGEDTLTYALARSMNRAEHGIPSVFKNSPNEVSSLEKEFRSGNYDNIYFQFEAFLLNTGDIGGSLAEMLYNISIAKQAQIDVFEEYGISVDQLAGTESAGFVKGKSVDKNPDISDTEFSFEKFARELSTQIYSRINELKDAKPLSREPGGIISVKARDERIAEAVERTREKRKEQDPSISVLEKASKIEEKSKAKVLSWENLRNLSRKNIKGENAGKRIIQRLHASFIAKGRQHPTVVIGTPQQLMDYAADRGIEFGPEIKFNDETKGFFDIEKGLIFIENAQGNFETVAHELAHFGTVVSFIERYSRQGGQESAPPNKNLTSIQNESDKAVDRIEHLFTKFFGENFPVHLIGKENRQFKEAVEDMMWEVARVLDLVDPNTGEVIGSSAVTRELITEAFNNALPIQKAIALNEFSVWSLTNRYIASKLKRMGIEDAIKASEGKVKKLFDFSSKVIENIHTLVFGRSLGKRKKTGNFPKPGDNFYDQLLFDMSVIMNAQDARGQELQNTVRSMDLGNLNVTYHRAKSKGKDVDRLLNLREVFNVRLLGQIDVLNEANVNNRVSADSAFNAVDSYVNHAVNLFGLNEVQKDTLSTFAAMYYTEAQIDGNVFDEINKIREEFMGSLKESDLNNDTGLAAQQYQFLMDNNDPATFLGLSMVSTDFRGLLKKVSKQGTRKSKRTLDRVIEETSEAAVKNISDRFSGINQSKDVLQRMDKLAQKIADNLHKEYARQRLEEAGGVGILEQMNANAVGLFDSIAGIAEAYGIGAESSDTSIGKAAGKTLKLFATVVGSSAVRANETEIGILNYLNSKTSSNGIFSHFIVDLLGRNSDNAALYDKIKNVTAFRRDLRKKYVELLPRNINSKFKKAPTGEQWRSLFRSIGNTDIVSLTDTMSLEEVIKLVSDPKKVDKEIARIENEILGMTNKQRTLEIIKKSKQLAHYMNTKEPGKYLLKNAESIAKHFSNGILRRNSVPAELIQAVDQLTSLYAVKSIPEADSKILQEISKSELEGISFTLAQLKGIRADEATKAQRSEIGRLNQIKGHLPTFDAPHHELFIARDVDRAQLEKEGYTRIADYKGSSIEPSKDSRGYYLRTFPAEGGMAMGILQNVKQTLNGASMLTGRMQSRYGDTVFGDYSIKMTAARMGIEKETNEPLIPIHNAEGEIIGLDRAVDPNILKTLKQNNRLDTMLAQKAERQAREEFDYEFQKEVLNITRDMWDKAIAKDENNKKLFFDLTKPETLPKHLQHAAKRINSELMAQGIEAFDGVGFMVRKDMLQDVIGRQHASIGDIFTGKSGLPQPVQNIIKGTFTAMFGEKAHRYLTIAEKAVQGVALTAKETIIVRSVVIPAINFASNVLMLMARGVPIKDIAKLPKKLNETKRYVANQERSFEIESLLNFETNPETIKKLQNELENIEKVNRNMSIWPLIEHGELGTIADLSFNADDLKLGKMDFVKWIEDQVDKLPAAARNTMRYGLMTRDTPIFKGIQQSVIYSDFISKAVLYDDLVRRGHTSKEALGKVTDEFVNYDRLPSRTRGYLESVGLLWFFNWKIRITQTFLRMGRENPLNLLIAVSLPVLAGMSLPSGENVFAKALSGKLGYSIGPGMYELAFGHIPAAKIAGI